MGLQNLVFRHAGTSWGAPCPEHTSRAFETLHRLVDPHKQEVVLDLGCGTGESTCALAAQFPLHLVLGIDRSEHRLRRAAQRSCPENARFVRCDAAHFCALACEAGWEISHLYFLYPNPYPKARHLRRRWHGHPIFPTLARIPAVLEMRSNWDVYAREFELGLIALGRDVRVLPVEHGTPISAFERKYMARGDSCIKVRSLPSRDHGVHASGGASVAR